MIQLTDEQWAQNQEEIRQLREQVKELKEHIQELTSHLQKAQERIAELESPEKEPPSFVKADVPPKEKKERKKRAPEHNRARRCEAPTEIVEHTLERCPDCHGRVSSVFVGRTRQVIEIPEPQPIIIREHRIERGWCSYCQQWKEAAVDLSQEVRGKSRVGNRLSALIVELRSIFRLPIRQIQTWLDIHYGLEVSIGEISEITTRVAQAGVQEYAAIRQQIQTSPVVHADETCWRESGKNGYIWLAMTPEGATYFEYHHSRAGAVIEKLLGEDFHGILETDFYAGYNHTPGGKHQRCWVHLLRDLHKLKVKHQKTKYALELQIWVGAIHALYLRAKQVASHPDESFRRRKVKQLHMELHALADQFREQEDHPAQTLAKRIVRFIGELLLFVVHPQVTPDNHRAERTIRPLVIARKISGGTRSPLGSQTRMILASLTATWRSSSLSIFDQFVHLLQTPLPQV